MYEYRVSICLIRYVELALFFRCRRQEKENMDCRCCCWSSSDSRIHCILWRKTKRKRIHIIWKFRSLRTVNIQQHNSFKTLVWLINKNKNKIVPPEIQNRAIILYIVFDICSVEKRKKRANMFSDIGENTEISDACDEGREQWKEKRTGNGYT